MVPSEFKKTLMKKNPQKFDKLRPKQKLLVDPKSGVRRSCLRSTTCHVETDFANRSFQPSSMPRLQKKIWLVGQETWGQCGMNRLEKKHDPDFLDEKAFLGDLMNHIGMRIESISSWPLRGWCNWSPHDSSQDIPLQHACVFLWSCNQG